VVLTLLLALWLQSATAKPAVFFKTPLTAAEMAHKQAVVQTSAGTFVIDLDPDLAPNHVGYFMKLANDGTYVGTIFHRLIKYGIIQGGDPLSKDPAQAARYGTGGLNELRFEANAEKHTRGAVSAVLVPGRRDSAGSQFFISVSDQPALDGQYTVFGRLADGLAVAQKISQVAADATVPRERIEIRRVTIRERPAPIPEPFLDASVADMARRRVVLETTLGNITIEVFPDRAPNHVRQFLRLAAGGVYDGTAFHRVAKGFVIQGGHMPTRREPPNERQEGYIRTLQPEFSQTTHVRGIVSMARGEDPASATTSFFIVLGPAPALDGRYSVFGRVVEGLDTVDKIEAQPVEGETPVTRIEVTRVRVEP